MIPSEVNQTEMNNEVIAVHPGSEFACANVFSYCIQNYSRLFILKKITHLNLPVVPDENSMVFKVNRIHFLGEFKFHSQLLRHFSKNQNCQPRGDAGKVRSSKSVTTPLFHPTAAKTVTSGNLQKMWQYSVKCVQMTVGENDSEMQLVTAQQQTSPVTQDFADLAHFIFASCKRVKCKCALHPYTFPPHKQIRCL